ncbi:ATP-binding protein [Pyrodictium abyssi]|uniref:ATP-binding protein n=1 Tax=Pyrodictium abyssi TaxID=54256 RepID=A0ABN6ZQ46_9CREN|nr:ATP-binding protein [Pyrodictium abyssi]
MLRIPFVDRVRELQMLENEYRRPSFSLVVVYGRRRVGKTRLLREWLHGKPGVYYVAAELPYESLAREFSEAVGRQLGLYVTPSDVVAALEQLASRRERVVVVLDEFQYLVEAEPSLPSRLMRSIDSVLAESELKLVLSGSAVSFFEKRLLGYRAPLHGRRTGQLRLRPMRMLEAWGFTPKLGPVDALRVYTVAGGTPAYLAHVYGVASVREALERILVPGSPLLEEALSVLRQELREPGTYARLLAAVAAGYTEPAKAAQKAGIDPRNVHHYVEVLEELDILERVQPLGRRRGARLRFRDSYFQFYFGVLVGLQSLVEAGYTGEAVEEALRRLDDYAARVFERWVEESLPELYRSGAVPVKPVEHGPWWHRGMEIDLVVREPERRAAFVEAKWSRLSLRDVKRLVADLEAKARRTGLQEPENTYIVVARELVDAHGPITSLDEARVAVDFSRLAPVLRRLLDADGEGGRVPDVQV